MKSFTFILIISVIFLFFFESVFSAVDSILPLQSISDGATLVSQDGRFELGFFGRGNSKNRYVGIWYKNIPDQTVVWVANRCNPINDSSGLLAINSTGNLVLLKQNKSVVWSTNSSKQVKKPIIQLLDSGNLVLRDEEDGNKEAYLWQSFDHPTDTLMPGMKLGWDLKRGFRRRLSAWKNWDDPCDGDLTDGIEFDPLLHTLPEYYIRKGPEKYYRSGAWNGLRFSGAPELRPNPLFSFDFVYNDDEVYYTFNLNSNSVISIVVINQTTSLHNRFTWSEADKNWRRYSSLPRDDCDKYSVCGANSNCMINNSPICECLRGFKPKSPEKWNSMDWSDGCVRNSPLGCLEKHKDGFIKFSGFKVPDATHSWLNKSLNLKECRAKCLSNCSCTAYTHSDIRGKGSGCAIWYGDLIDVRQFPSGGQDIFIRMPHSELGKVDNKMRAVIVVSVIGVVSGISLVGYWICRRRSKDKTDRNEAQSQNGGEEEDLELPLLNLSTIATATEYFSLCNKLGEGGFGPVYKGKLVNGQEIAVKRLSISSWQGVKELKNEVNLIAKLQHRNLVKLLGCCIQGEEKLLVYEYMPNKSLDLFIFDFGLARTFGGEQTEEKTNRVIGTYGYMAPEYAFNGLFSAKSDVFSFGILMLEIVSGKKNRGFHYENHGLTLIGHAWKLHKEGNSFVLLDKHVRESQYNLKQVLHCIHVGLLCVQQNPIDRPNMSSVVLMLETDSELPQPKPPGYFIEKDSTKGDHSSTKPESCSTNDMSISIIEAR